MNTQTTIWIFNGNGGTFPGGAFSTYEAAESWIARHRLTGTLTRYPLDVGIYDWAVERGYVTGNFSNERIGRFSSAYLEHHHFEDGQREA